MKFDSHWLVLVALIFAGVMLGNVASAYYLEKNLKQE